MYVDEVIEVFGSLTPVVELLPERAQSSIYRWQPRRSKVRRLVPILAAFRLHELRPDAFPPVNWKLYEAEEQRRYEQRKGRKKPRKHR